MSQSFDEVLQAALALSEEDRQLLICHLQGDGVPPSLEPWREEIDRRCAEYDAGRMEAIPWEEVKEEARRAVDLHE